MQVYEVGFLVLPSIPEEGISTVVEKVHKAALSVGATALDGETPIMIDLAYPMTKTVGASRYVATEAYLGWNKFELEPEKALAFKAALQSIDELLRFLLIKAPRESSFTFAKAQALIAEKEAEERAPKETASTADAVVE